MHIMMASIEPGDQLDHYRIEALAMRTSMTTIYRATDLRTGCAVAIKIPHFEMECDPAFFSRFQREAEIGRKLDHPNVAKVVSNGDMSRVCIVMEWAEGKVLRQILGEQGKLPAERAVQIALRICEALEYIHREGIVHRDLKPENIMVDAQDNIKLIDFGIAASAGARRLTFSKFSSTLGTPDYISPEQVKGKRGDARSDVYALGVMLYEMLTGKVPFEGPNPFAVMNGRLLNHPIPPREANPEVSPEMQEMIYRALEREPSRRYASASEFAMDLKHPEKVVAADREEHRNWKPRRSPGRRRVLSYMMIAMIPVIIFALLLFVARHK
jgi:eukaryotic-like serine/threonine-protein kinase